MQLPQSWTYFENFIQAWKQANMATAFRNSFIILVFVLFGSIMTGSMLAYVLSRFKFKGNGLIRNLFLFCSAPSGNCDAGAGISDYVYAWVDQQSPGVYYPHVWNGCYLHLYFHSSFCRIYQLHWMNQRSWTDVPISECFSVSCCRS